MVGIQITHPTLKSVTAVVTDPARPYQVPFLCPTCHVIHEHKTLHIGLDDRGSCLVSAGVLESLKKAGAIDTPGGFRVTGHTNNPPALTISRGMSRDEIDFRNRAQTIHNTGGHP